MEKYSNTMATYHVITMNIVIFHNNYNVMLYYTILLYNIKT